MFFFKRFLLVVLVLSSTSCAMHNIDPYTGGEKVSNTTQNAGWGGLIGAGGGAALGAIFGGGEGAAIGAAAGAVAGGAAGYYTGYQADKAEDVLRRRLRGTGVQVVNTRGNIDLIMSSDITFDTNKFNVKHSFYPVLESVATVLYEYKVPQVIVIGHTDSTGEDGYNYDLSVDRASSVADVLSLYGVEGNRLRVVGAGETRPVASNKSVLGRAENRRVEIQLRGNQQ